MNYRIKYTEQELSTKTDSIIDKEYSTKWMTLSECLEHKAMNNDNAEIIKREG